MVRYQTPQNWINYRKDLISTSLIEAKASVMSLINMPYQRSWVEVLQKIQLKREVAGTSRIEGADFTDRELDAALVETPEQVLNRSQRQARAAMSAYKWIAELPKDRPINTGLILEVHSLIVRDADDDHCPPGKIRKNGENVNFGIPPHRGCEGGEVCEQAFERFSKAINEEFREHDLLVQALALHFHFAAMHPFLDGNGRTARAVEALMLQRAGLTDHLFIAMSNYYYDEKKGYLESLSAVSAPDYDLTPFLVFGLKGIKLQCDRLFHEIKRNVEKSIFRNTMLDLYGHLSTKRKRVIKDRHTGILNMLLERDEMNLTDLLKQTRHFYSGLRAGDKAQRRDIFYLTDVGAVGYKKGKEDYVMFVDLSWPKKITENGFIEKVKAMPKAKSNSLSHWFSG
jgi:Fic family protein